jgi:hypothetical protein
MADNRGSKPGEKRGGRQKGTPNKKTLGVTEKLEALACDPIEGIARTAMDETQPMALRTSIYRELAQYVTPKRKALEHKGEMAANFRASEAQRSTPAS